MRESYWGYWLILLGIFVIVVMMLVQNATTTNTRDYYQLKEVANSAMYDSIDYAYYSQTGDVRIMKEIYVANFIKRFSETVSLTDTYTLDFYDLYESPPKVSVKISTQTGSFMVSGESTSVDVTNSIDIITEIPYDDTYKSIQNGGNAVADSMPDGASSIVTSKSCTYYLDK